jgi:hypothetical protein
MKLFKKKFYEEKMGLVPEPMSVESENTKNIRNKALDEAIMVSLEAGTVLEAVGRIRSLKEKNNSLEDPLRQ